MFKLKELVQALQEAKVDFVIPELRALFALKEKKQSGDTEPPPN